MINYGGFYVNATGPYKALNPVIDVQGDKTVKKVLFLSVGTGKLFTMLEDEFLQKFKEMEKE